MIARDGARRGAAGVALAVALSLTTSVVLARPAPPPSNAAPTDVDARSADGSTALLWAVYSGDTQRVAELLKAGAKVATPNNFGATPMGEAARTGNTEMLGLLLKAGADPESPNSEGQTALLAVARTGNLEAAKLLLRHGAKVDAREQWGGQTPLMWAAAQAQPEMVRLLLSKGAQVNARAVVRDWQRRVTAEGRPKDMNRGGLTPLLYAAREGYVECARELIRGKADVNLADPDGTTPLILALMNGHWDVAKLLIDSGADVNLWDFWGQSPLYMAVDMTTLPAGFRIEMPSLDETTGNDLIKLLLAKGANPNVQLKLRPPYRNAVQDRNADSALITGATPLMRAAVAADAGTIEQLLAAGALVDLPNEEGTTPLIAAVSASGTRGKLKTEEQTIAAVKLLQTAGADVNASNRLRLTAMHGAALRGWNDVIRELAGLHASLDATEADGLTPIDYALGRSRVGFLQTKPPVRTETADVLRQLGATQENPNPPAWPAVPTPTLTAQVPE